MAFATGPIDEEEPKYFSDINAHRTQMSVNMCDVHHTFIELCNVNFFYCI